MKLSGGVRLCNSYTKIYKQDKVLPFYINAKFPWGEVGGVTEHQQNPGKLHTEQAASFNNKTHSPFFLT
jgi:hypothetical protein